MKFSGNSPLMFVAMIAVWALVIWLFFQIPPSSGLTADPHAYDPRAFHCNGQMKLPCDGTRP
jgi:hypothetical protein